MSTSPRRSQPPVSRPEVSRVRPSPPSRSRSSVTRRDPAQPPLAGRVSASELEVLFLSEIVAAHADVRTTIDAAFSNT